MKIRTLEKAVKHLPKLKYCGAVVVAAGSAQRMGGIDKIMAPLGDEPVIVHSVRQLQNCDAIREIVVVTREDLMVSVMALCHRFDKLKAVLVGADTRAESVRIGLEAMSARVKLVAVHDGARPLADCALIDRTVRAANAYGAAAPAIALKDTVKAVQGGMTSQSPDRDALCAVQTPQVFDYDLLSAALTQAKKEKWKITDDCSAVEKMGMRVRLVKGEERNIKITTPLDLKIAQLLLEENA